MEARARTTTDLGPGPGDPGARLVGVPHTQAASPGDVPCAQGMCSMDRPPPGRRRGPRERETSPNAGRSSSPPSARKNALIVTSPSGLCSILSMPLGPNEERRTRDTALQAWMLAFTASRPEMRDLASCSCCERRMGMGEREGACVRDRESARTRRGRLSGHRLPGLALHPAWAEEAGRAGREVRASAQFFSFPSAPPFLSLAPG